MQIEKNKNIGIYTGTAKIGSHYYYASGYTHLGVISKMLKIANVNKDIK